MRSSRRCGPCTRQSVNTSDVTAAVAVADALNAAAAVLREAGVPNARREAIGIWSALRGIGPGDAWFERSAPMPADAVGIFRAAVATRARGVPTAYACGRAAFRHLTLAVDRRVLIPRPETEGLVDRVLAEAPSRSDLHVLEIGVGSGAVILSLAVERAFGRLVGTDISSDALAVARANAASVAPTASIEWRAGDLFSPVAGERFDVIVSNPPYIAPAEFEMLDPSVRLHEPRLALESGDRGMAHIRRICREVSRFLTPNGLLAIEIDARRGNLAAASARQAGLREVRVEFDLFGRERYLLARNA